MEPVVELLSRLIAIPSVNPEHEDNPDITGEKRLAEFLKPLCEERGLRTEFLYPCGPGRPALIARARPETVRRSLMVEVHLDTVGVSQMTIPPFEASVRDGRIYGRGACDVKGPAAAFLQALTPQRTQALLKKGVELMFLAAPNEETALGGSTRLAADGMRADDALILEPTGCLPVTAHKGSRWYEVILKGRSGHGSQPQSGISTTAALAEFLPELLRIHEELAGRFTHPLLWESTLNIGKIEGGQTFNIIPDTTRMELDRRLTPTEPLDAFPDAVERLLRNLTERGILLSGRINLVRATTPFSTPEDAALVKTLQSAITRDTGEPAPVRGTSWVSDAAPFSQVCEQTVVFGPGDINQAHTEDEYITADQLNRGVRIFADFLDRYEPGER